MSMPELFQFNFSHFNEKVRWSLDHKRIPHVRRSLLPGPHLLSTIRLSGQKQVPVLRLDGEAIVGSAHIIDRLEERWPEPALYPAEAAQRRRALEIQRWFDDDVGPQIRRAMFFEILPDASFSTTLFTRGQPPLARRVYRASFPAIRAVMRRDMHIDAAGAGRGLERTREALDFVAANRGAGGYLVGDSFTVADLTAASLLFPAVMPDEVRHFLPDPQPPVLRDWLGKWADHPGAAWVRDMFHRHRGDSAEVAF